MKDIFYIAGGAIGGWLLAKKILGESSYRRNSQYEKWSLDWMDPDGEPSKFESSVLVGQDIVGSIIMLTPKKWQAYDKKYMPFGEFASSEAAARAVYNRWSGDEFLTDLFSKSEKKPRKKTPAPKPRTKKQSGSYEIAWANQQEGDIHVGGNYIGSISMIDPGNWAAYEGTKIEPFERGISSKKKAAEKVFKRFKGLRDLPEPTLVKVKLPDWVTDVEIEPTVGVEGERFLIWVGDDRAGIIEKRGGRYDAYIFTPRGDRQLEIGASKKRAVLAVYVSHKLLDYLPRQTVRGKKMSYTPKRYKTLPPKKGQKHPRKVEQLRYKKHFVQQSDYEISKDLEIPEKEVILYGTKLAERYLIYGIKSQRRQKSFKKIDIIGKETPAPDKGRRKRHRREISHPDIEKLRKGGMLSKEERKALPSIRKKTVYYFAMVGPKGEVGFDIRAHGVEWEPSKE